jgi:hypothetical protein
VAALVGHLVFGACDALGQGNDGCMVILRSSTAVSPSIVRATRPIARDLCTAERTPMPEALVRVASPVIIDALPMGVTMHASRLA